MFKFIKDMFRKEAEKADIRLEDLPAWLDEKTRPALDDTRAGINEKTADIRGVLHDLEEDIKSLDRSDLSQDDQNVPNKVKNVVFGHRENYVRVMSDFADSIEIPEELEFKDITRLISDIEEGLDKLSKATAKSHMAVQHLFSRQLEKIADDLKQISRLAAGMKKIFESNKIGEIEGAKSRISYLADLRMKNKKLSERLREQGKELLRLANMRRKIEENIGAEKGSQDNKVLADLNKELEQTEEKLSEKESEIVQLFSQLEYGLRKFKRITLEGEKLVEEYSQSAASALLSDKDLKIIHVLQGMKDSIMSGNLDLKEDKRKKTLQTINIISSERLSSIVSGYRNLLDNRESLKKKISLNPVKYRIKEHKYKLDHISSKIDKLNSEIDMTEKKLSQDDSSGLKAELENLLKDITCVEVTII